MSEKKFFENNSNNMETQKSQQETFKATPDVSKDLADDVLRAQKSDAEVQQALANEAEVPGKYNEVLKSVKEEMTPEQIKDRIKFCQQKIEDWQTLTTISKQDTGMGALGAFGGAGAEDLLKRYPSLANVYQKIDQVKKENSVGFKFWKTPNLDDVTAQAFKNKLITGSFGNFVGPQGEKLQAQIAEKFEKYFGGEQQNEENKEGENIEKFTSSARDIILGSDSMNTYKKELEELTAKLNPQEKMAA